MVISRVHLYVMTVNCTDYVSIISGVSAAAAIPSAVFSNLVNYAIIMTLLIRLNYTDSSDNCTRFRSVFVINVISKKKIVIFSPRLQNRRRYVEIIWVTFKS